MIILDNTPIGFNYLKSKKYKMGVDSFLWYSFPVLFFYSFFFDLVIFIASLHTMSRLNQESINVGVWVFHGLLNGQVQWDRCFQLLSCPSLMFCPIGTRPSVCTPPPHGDQAYVQFGSCGGNYYPIKCHSYFPV